MTKDPAQIAAALGHVPTAAQYVLPSGPPVPPSLFGKDHWSTLAYIETRTVDHGGLLDHANMRCDDTRHPMMAAARPLRPRTQRTQLYPTMLKDSDTPGPDGRYGKTHLPDHDDYDCADDLMAAGLLTLAMPPVDDSGVYVNRRGKPIMMPGTDEPIRFDFLTGMNELYLAANGRWSLTPRGRYVAGKLRGHIADGLRAHDFVMPSTRHVNATAATIRRGLDSKAVVLRSHGWTVITPDHLARLDDSARKYLDQINAAQVKSGPQHLFPELRRG